MSGHEWPPNGEENSIGFNEKHLTIQVEKSYMTWFEIQFIFVTQKRFRVENIFFNLNILKDSEPHYSIKHLYIIFS